MEVLGIKNQELKRVCTERVGWTHLLKGQNLRKIQSNDWGTLYRLTPNPLGDDGRYSACFLKVICPSTGREYFNRVDPRTETVLEALSVRFSCTEQEFVDSQHS